MMYESPLARLSDDQIVRAIDSALERGDAAFLDELVEELGRRGHDVEV
jgi:hypothetical protein